MWTSANVWANPIPALRDAAGSRDIVRGLVPSDGITWMYGASMSFKSFIAMSMAVSASRGDDWLGRVCEDSIAIFIGAEGGAPLHIRRAAAEISAGASEKAQLYVVQERPQLDTAEGAAQLRGLLNGLTGLFSNREERLSEKAAFTSMHNKYFDEEAQDRAGEMLAVVVFIDTYSQTSCGDDKSNVAAYVKNLRDTIDCIDGGWRMSFVVIDHATKSGGSYMGSVAKLNDVDSQIEIIRDGSSNRATIYQRKTKDGAESAPLDVELSPFTFDDYNDSYGDPITTLVAKDGSTAARMAKLADGKASVLLSLLQRAGGSMHENALREAFSSDPSNHGIKPDSVNRAFRRSLDSIISDCVADKLVNGTIKISE